jgi:hydroxymethylpyrimidine pyrophosphatase-like HAD family hydrolase
MPLPIQLISTDFDGTLHADFENPPVPLVLQQIIADLQRRGASWVINTGRDLSSLLETMGRAHLHIKPDFIVGVEREIYEHQGQNYVGVQEWNDACSAAHEGLFTKVRQDIEQLTAWVNGRFPATIYSDIYSPFCLIAEDNHDMNLIQAHLEAYCKQVPGLTIVRNDVYARFSHVDYNKGTALAEIGRRVGVSAARTLAAGDHFNDLPMLVIEFAHMLVAPVNAIEQVKEKVLWQKGYVSSQPFGHGVARGLEYFLMPGIRPESQT